MELFRNILLIGCGLGIIILIIASPRRLGRFAKWFFTNAVLGIAILLVINYFSSSLGILLPINALTLGVSGVMGIPGVAALALLAAV